MMFSLGLSTVTTRQKFTPAAWQTLYRHVAPDGTLRKDGLKVVEGGKIRGKKK
jgi:hypothetical protein